MATKLPLYLIIQRVHKLSRGPFKSTMVSITAHICTTKADHAPYIAVGDIYGLGTQQFLDTVIECSMVSVMLNN